MTILCNLLVVSQRVIFIARGTDPLALRYLQNLHQQVATDSLIPWFLTSVPKEVSTTKYCTLTDTLKISAYVHNSVAPETFHDKWTKSAIYWAKNEHRHQAKLNHHS